VAHPGRCRHLGSASLCLCVERSVLRPPPRGAEAPRWNYGKHAEARSHGSGYRARFSGLPVLPTGGCIPRRCLLCVSVSLCLCV
ncbi:MAG: hypothetical protein AVDCRST_MAG68-1912, partial [uncultured Gemmatimonadetes bacterium]